MFVLFKDDRIGVLSDPHIRREGVRLWNLGEQLQIPPWSFRMKVCRAPSGRTVSIVTACAIGAGTV